jgi:HTH-type transcriptional regulator / antitoxin HipB
MDPASRTQKQLGAELRRYRKSRGRSQTELSQQIGKRQATISNLESAGRGTIDTLYAILSALDLELLVQPRTKGERTKLGDIF